MKQISTFCADPLEEAREVIADQHRFSLEQVLDAATSISLWSNDDDEIRWASTVINVHKRTMGFSYRETLTGIVFASAAVAILIISLTLG